MDKVLTLYLTGNMLAELVLSPHNSHLRLRLSGLCAAWQWHMQFYHPAGAAGRGVDQGNGDDPGGRNSSSSVGKHVEHEPEK